MIKSIAIATITAALALGGQVAVAQTTQQSKMKTCNVDAKGKKGDERRAFMKSCLSKKADGAASDSKKR
jgi:hypothetical protein